MMSQIARCAGGTGQPTVTPLPVPPYDARFHALVGSDAWNRLPIAVQRRFAKRLTGDAVVLYRGRVVVTRLSRAGWWLAQICRLIGAPLPLYRDPGVPAVVTVSDDAVTGGQCWTRTYGRTRGFPQVIHSAKRFAGPTGLEEYVGRGIGMALTVSANQQGIVFKSAHYFIAVAGRRIRLPRWLTPGTTIVTHRDIGAGRFAFDLSVTHYLLGELVHQHAIFEDV